MRAALLALACMPALQVVFLWAVPASAAGGLDVRKLNAIAAELCGSLEELPGELEEARHYLAGEDARKKARAAYSKLLLACKKLVVAEGRSIDSEPTDEDNYRRRRLILVELAELFSMKGYPIKPIFPEGDPRVMLPPDVFTAKQAAYCDKTLKRLSSLYALEIGDKRGADGAAAGGGGAGGSGSGAVAGADGAAERDTDSSPGVRPPQTERGGRSSWYISLYFDLTLYILGAIAAAGLLYLLVSSRREARELAGGVRTSGAGDASADAAAGGISSSHTAAFRDAMRLYRRGMYGKAAEAFALMLGKKGMREAERKEIMYYRLLSLLKDGAAKEAEQELSRLKTSSFTMDELYRLAESCMQASLPRRAVWLLQEVVKRDPTYRDAARILDRLKDEDGRPE